MDAKRFKYNSTSQQITDSLTGYRYYGNKQVTDLLNEVNERADKNAEKYTDLLQDYHHIMVSNEIMKERLRAFDKVMRKYHIDNVEKLDRVLFEQRVW